MNVAEQFEFLNSELWLRYTEKEYKTLEDIRFRLKSLGEKPENWNEVSAKIKNLRKLNAVPLFIDCINKKFWFFPADCILRKAHELEKLGSELHSKILQNSNFSNDFFVDSVAEEAITSALYEGANSTRAKAHELIASQALPTSKDDWMLLNNYETLSWLKNNRDTPHSLNLINEVHALITKNTLSGDDANFSGAFRNDRVFVRASDNTVKHEGMNHLQVESCLKEVFSLVSNHSRYFPNLLKGILLHYFIALIHPYFDGNGRTARAIFYFESIRNSLSFVELLSVSAYLKNHGRQYESSFEKVQENDLDLTYFIDFNLDALLEAVKKVNVKVEFLLKINLLKDSLNLSNAQIGLLQRTSLNRFLKIDIERYAKQIGKSREIARQELKRLSEYKLMKEEKSGNKFLYSMDKKVLLDLLKNGNF